MARLPSKLTIGRGSLVESVLPVLVALALPRRALPTGLPLICAALAWSAFAASLLPLARRARWLWQLAAAASLAALALLAPPVWLAVALSLSALGLLVLRRAALGACQIALGVGLLGPAVLYGVVFAAGADERVALRLAFRVSASPVELAAYGLTLLLAVALTLAFLDQQRPAPESALRVRWLLVGSVVGVLGLRLAWVASLAVLPSDLMIWSEAPALTNLLKLHTGEPFYGPPAWANSYSYSPGLELTQYALLRPFQLELSLRAHRALGILWQLSSAALLSHAVWGYLAGRLRPDLARLAYPTVLVALFGVTLSSLLAPHVHPDHLLMLCFSAAIWLCSRSDAFDRRYFIALALLPAVATLYKLTGAGIGVGLVLAALFERRPRALGVLLLAGTLALLTIPLCDATLGQFTNYAIRLQASHPIDWLRLEQVPGSAPGLMFIVSSLSVACAAWARPVPVNWRAATRVLLLSFGFGLPSLVAYCKHGGRENSLLPFGIGGTVALLILLGGALDKPADSADARPLPSSSLALIVLFWSALSLSWPVDPVLGDTRTVLLAAHQREVSWLREELARGAHPLSQGSAAWIEVGRRDPPRDRLSSQSELELGHSAELVSSENRLLNGTYDGLFLAAGALTANPFLLRLRVRLERVYRVVEPSTLRGQWPTSDDGYVILERR